MLCLLRRAHGDYDRARNDESARDDSRRDCHCYGKAALATCNRRAARWPFGNHRGRRILLSVNNPVGILGRHEGITGWTAEQ